MLDRILAKPGVTGEDTEDCMACRLIGGGGLGVLGTYILFKTYTGRHSMKKWSLMGSACLGSVILSIASLRLLDIRLNPKEDNKHKTKH